MWIWLGVRRRGWLGKYSRFVSIDQSDGNDVCLSCDSPFFTLRLCLILGATQSSCTSYKTHAGQGVNSKTSTLHGAMEAAGITWAISRIKSVPKNPLRSTWASVIKITTAWIHGRDSFCPERCHGKRMLWGEKKAERVAVTEPQSDYRQEHGIPHDACWSISHS